MQRNSPEFRQRDTRNFHEVRYQAVGFTERVDVIGNKKFIEFVEQLEREEDLQLDTFEVGKDKVVIVTISPRRQKGRRQKGRETEGDRGGRQKGTL